MVDVGVVDPWLLQVAAHASTGIASLDSLRFAFGRTYLAAAATARHAVIGRDKIFEDGKCGNGGWRRG